MDTFNTTLLKTVFQLSHRLGPIASLADSIIDRLAPKATAQASCPGGWFYYTCGPCCARCSGDSWGWTTYYYASGSCTTCPPYVC